MPLTAIPAFLNCNRRQAELLVREGLIPRLVPDSTDRGGVLKNVAIEDLDTFLARFRSRGQQVSIPREGMADVIAMSENIRVAVLDIVRMVLDGDLKEIELLPANLKFRSGLVNPDEILDVLEKRILAGEESHSVDLAA